MMQDRINSAFTGEIIADMASMIMIHYGGTPACRYSSISHQKGMGYSQLNHV